MYSNTQLFTCDNVEYENQFCSQEEEYLEPISTRSSFLLPDSGVLTLKTIAILEEEDCLDIGILTSLSSKDCDKLFNKLTMGQKHMLRNIVNDYKNPLLHENYNEHRNEIPEEKKIPCKLKDALHKEDLDLFIFFELPKIEKEDFYMTLSLGHSHLLKQSVESMELRKHSFQKPTVYEEPQYDYAEIKDIDCESSCSTNRNLYVADTDISRELGGRQLVSNVVSKSDAPDKQQVLFSKKGGLPDSKKKRTFFRHSTQGKRFFKKNDETNSTRYCSTSSLCPIIGIDPHTDPPSIPPRDVELSSAPSKNALATLKRISKHLGESSKRDFKTFMI